MALYADPDELKVTLHASGTTYLDDDADRACLAASAGIDQELGRTFGKDSSDVRRSSSRALATRRRHRRTDFSRAERFAVRSVSSRNRLARSSHFGL